MSGQSGSAVQGAIGSCSIPPPSNLPKITLSDPVPGFNNVKVDWSWSGATGTLTQLKIMYQPRICLPIICSPDTIRYDSPAYSLTSHTVSFSNNKNADKTLRFTVVAKVNIDGTVHEVRSASKETTTYPFLSATLTTTSTRATTDILNDAVTLDRVLETARLKLNIDWPSVGTPDVHFAVTVPESTGVQIGRQCKATWPSTTSALSSLAISGDTIRQHNVDLIRCGRGEATSKLTVSATKTSTRTAIPADIEFEIGQATYQQDAIVRYVIEETTNVPEGFEYKQAVATAAAVWNDADLGVTYSDVSQNVYSGDVVTVKFASSVPCRSGGYACVHPAHHSTTHPHMSSQTLYIRRTLPRPQTKEDKCNAYEWTSEIGEIGECEISAIQVLIHEFGHTAGLDDSRDRGDIMYWRLEAAESDLRQASDESLVNPLSDHEKRVMRGLYPSSSSE